MKEQILREAVRVLFHLNGYTKILLERTEGLGMADGGIVWEIATDVIPPHLRKIGSRFIVQYKQPSSEEMSDINSIRKAGERVKVIELNDRS